MSRSHYHLAALVAIITACADPATAPQGSLTSPPSVVAPLYTAATGARVAPGIYSVIYNHDVVNSRALTAHLRNAHKFALRHEWNEPWMKGFSGRLTDKDVEKLRRHPHVSYVSQVQIGRGGGTQSFPPNWGLDRIDQRQLPLNNQYVYTDSAPNVIAYIIDSGIRRSHIDFEGRAYVGIDVVDDGGPGIDCAGHGTPVAAVVGGRSYGVAKKVQLWSVRIMWCNGDVYSDDAVTGINWVTNDHNTFQDPAVANLSLEWPNVVPEIDQAIAASINAGVTYVVLAGNYNANACNYTPAHTLGTITVGATDAADFRWINSNYGACLNLFAPGHNIATASNFTDNAETVVSGTSLSAPHVAGIAAVYLGRNSSASPATVKSAIVNNATTGVVMDPGPNSPNRLAYSRF